MKYDVIVIGGGASGMMAAGRAAELGAKVALLEKNNVLGAKLKISGGGRCNITNAEFNTRRLLSHYGDAEKFLYSSFAKFGVAECFDFFSRLGVELKIEARNRAFPLTDSSQDVIDALVRYMDNHSVDVYRSTSAKKIEKLPKGFNLHTKNGIFHAHKLIVATGGVSRPETGSNGDGWRWLSHLGHQVTEPTPTIVPLRVSNEWVKALSGVTLKDVRLYIYVNGVRVHRIDGDILCTHFGISGPTILNNSSKIASELAKGEVLSYIDLFPGLDEGALQTYLLEMFHAHQNKDLKNTLKYILPAGTYKGVMLELQKSIDLTTKVHTVTRETRKSIARLLQHMPLHIEGLMGMDVAVVADGGVSLHDVDTRTFESKIISGLYVTGDMLHINRPSGGYSLQLCWTSGWVAGTHSAEGR